MGDPCDDDVTLVTCDGGARVAGPMPSTAVDAVLPVLAMVAKGHQGILSGVAHTAGEGKGEAPPIKEGKRVG